MRVTAPCKINLHLRVLERRRDGFHDIESVFQLISLADELSVSMAGDDRSCEVVSPLMALPRENTITAAVDAFRKKTGIAKGLRIKVSKRVPSGAGLGGGSSDAASVLMALDRMFGTALPRPELASMAASIGSDVPFFLCGGAAVVEGRGRDHHSDCLAERPLRRSRVAGGCRVRRVPRMASWTVPMSRALTASSSGRLSASSKKCIDLRFPDGNSGTVLLLPSNRCIR